MSKIRVISYLTKFENFMGIYRNFSLCGTKLKTCIIVRFFIEMLLNVIIVISNSFLVHFIHMQEAETGKINKQGINLFTMFYAIKLNSDFIMVICGLLYTNDYKMLINDLNKLHRACRNISSYKKSLKQITYISIIGCVSLSSIRIILTVAKYFSPIFTIISNQKASSECICYTFLNVGQIRVTF